MSVSSPPKRLPRRGGFSLIELLVVVAIIAILIALIMAAAQKARDAADRVRCANNLRQIGIAINSFESVYRVFPSDGGQQAPNQPDFGTISNQHWGAADPSMSPKNSSGPWTYTILPYLEENNVYQAAPAVRWSTAVSAYLCPSRARHNPQVAPPVDPYSGSTTRACGYNPFSKSDYAANLWVCPANANQNALPSSGPSGMYPIGPPLRKADIINGLSKTIHVGEKTLDPASYNTGGWFYDEPIVMGGSGGLVRWNTNIYQDAPGIAHDEGNWGSCHAYGSFFLFADGHVQTLRYSTPTNIVQVLMTYNVMEAVDPSMY